MKIEVHVKANSSKEGIEQIADSIFLVRVNTVPVDGKANARVQELLAKHFKVAKSQITLSRGHKSRIKIFEIE